VARDLSVCGKWISRRGKRGPSFREGIPNVKPAAKEKWPGKWGLPLAPADRGFWLSVHDGSIVDGLIFQIGISKREERLIMAVNITKRTVAVDAVAKKILVVRGLKVMLDSDLAGLYGVRTKELNKAVQRNKGRFPKDFMFRLIEKELNLLRFQIGTSKGRGGRRYLPYVFTQEGVAMLSSVLRSNSAIRVNIQIMRAFVRLRDILAVHKDLARRLETLEKKFDSHDAQFKVVFDAIRDLIRQPEKPKGYIGFV
jgi:hypothetical protein